MRELKFRAYWNDSCYVGWSVPFTLLAIQHGQVMADRDDEGSDYEPLSLAKAIVQYTGLKDKNGVEIYQGDRLRRWFQKENPAGVSSAEWHISYITVEWSDSFAGFTPFCYLPAWLTSADRLEVIGNIHENPELLEV